MQKDVKWKEKCVIRHEKQSTTINRSPNTQKTEGELKFYATIGLYTNMLFELSVPYDEPHVQILLG